MDVVDAVTFGFDVVTFLLFGFLVVFGFLVGFLDFVAFVVFLVDLVVVTLVVVVDGDFVVVVDGSNFVVVVFSVVYYEKQRINADFGFSWIGSVFFKRKNHHFSIQINQIFAIWKANL